MSSTGSPLDVGPVIALPTAALFAAPFAGSIAIAALVIAWAATNNSSAMSAAICGGAAAAIAHGLAVLAIRPWKPRHLGRWAFTVLASTGVSILAVLILMLSLYSATRPDRVVFALTTAGSWTGGLFALVAAYARIIRPHTRTPNG